MSLGHCSANIMTLSQKRFLDSDDWKECQKYFRELEMKKNHKVHSCENGVCGGGNSNHSALGRKIVNRKHSILNDKVRHKAVSDILANEIVDYIVDYVMKSHKEDFTVPFRKSGCITKRCKYDAERNEEYTGFLNKKDNTVFISRPRLAEICAGKFDMNVVWTALVDTNRFVFGYDKNRDIPQVTKGRLFEGKVIHYYEIKL